MKTTNLNDFLTLLQRDLTETPNYDLDGETLHEFEGFPHIELGVNRESENFSIYLTLSPMENDNPGELLTEFVEQFSFKAFPILMDYLQTLFSENTNNDSCSFSFEIDTDHWNITNEPHWDLILTVTDYFS